MKRFLKWLGLEVDVLGRVGIDVILATPLPFVPLPVLAPPETAATAAQLEGPRLVVNEALAGQLMHVDGLLHRALTWCHWRMAPRGRQ